ASCGHHRADAALEPRRNCGPLRDPSPTGGAIQCGGGSGNGDLAIRATLRLATLEGDVVADRARSHDCFAGDRQSYVRQPSASTGGPFSGVRNYIGLGVRTRPELVLRSGSVVLHSQQRESAGSLGSIGRFLFTPGWPVVRVGTRFP